MRSCPVILSRGVVLFVLACGSLATGGEPVDSRQANLRLLDAAAAGDAVAVERLLREGASVKTRNRFGATPLIQAARRGHTAAVRALLAAGAEVDQANLEQATPLLETARNGHLETARVLIQNGSEVNRVDLQLLSPLMHAVFGGHVPLVRLLLESGLMSSSSIEPESQRSSMPRQLATWRSSRSFWIEASK